MNCVVTAGPTYEPLDQVRRLTNFSTGRLGSELAKHLSAAGHKVKLLLGEQATCRIETGAADVLSFTTTSDLAAKLRSLGREPVDAVFHAAAVSDFRFGKVWSGTPEQRREVSAGKLSTRDGPLLAELVPTPKLIAELRSWFPQAKLVGWKFEVAGGREHALALAKTQLQQCRTDACIANGAAYGAGFGFVTADGRISHLQDQAALLAALADWLARR